jgi:hypothetical protein
VQYLASALSQLDFRVATLVKSFGRCWEAPKVLTTFATEPTGTLSCDKALAGTNLNARQTPPVPNCKIARQGACPKLSLGNHPAERDGDFEDPAERDRDFEIAQRLMAALSLRGYGYV